MRMSPARRTSRTSIASGGSSAARTQKSARPCALLGVGERAGLIARRSRPRRRGSCPCTCRRRRLRQPYGIIRSARIAAASTVSPSSQAKRVIAGLYGNLVRHRVALAACAFVPRRGTSVIRVLLIGCGDIALRTAELLRSQGQPLRPHAPAGGHSRSCAQHGIIPIIGDLDRYHSLERAARGAFRGAALRAAAGRWSRRSAHRAADRRADKGADYTAATSSTSARPASMATAPGRA